MPYLRASALVEAQSVEVEMSDDEEMNHELLSSDTFLGTLHDVGQNRSRLICKHKYRSPTEFVINYTSLSKKPHRPLSKSIFSSLIDSLASLFSQDHPQPPNHGDFLITNILVYEESFEIMGVVEWPLAAIMPSGMDLDILFMTTGFMTLDGWNEHARTARLLGTIRKEFWATSGIEGDDCRGRVRATAEAAGKIAAVLRVAFRRNADGSSSEEALMSGTGIK